MDRHSKSGPFNANSSNPYDVNLLDFKGRKSDFTCVEAILFSETLEKFNFNDFKPYSQVHVVFTKSSIRIYESKGKAVSTYGKPFLALPLSAVAKIERIKFDVTDDSRMEKAD